MPGEPTECFLQFSTSAQTSACLANQAHQPRGARQKITACPLQLSPQTHTILPTMRITSSLRQLSSITPRFNETITEDGKEKLQVLLKNGWNLSKNGIGIEKAYEFRGFSRAMKFIRFVADEAKDKKHHPEWANVRFT